MKIRLLDTNYDQPIFGVSKVNGIYDLSLPQIEKFKAFGGQYFMYVKDDCEKCKKLSEENIELHLEVSSLKDEIEKLKTKARK